MPLREIQDATQSGRDRRRKETADEALTRIFEATIGMTARRYHERRAAPAENKKGGVLTLRPRGHAS